MIAWSHLVVGKDSTFQVLKVLEYGMNPLVVTITTDWLTPIGRKKILKT